ncbi:MAG: hypothetical protein RL043_320, partial [Pseudomonadota bacterium]
SVAAGAGYHWLVGVAAVNSTIALYNYLRIVRQMYIEPVRENDMPPPPGVALGITTGVLCAVVVLLGIIPFFYNAINTSTRPFQLLFRPRMSGWARITSVTLGSQAWTSPGCSDTRRSCTG